MLHEQQSLHNFNNRDTFPRHSLALQASQAYIYIDMCIYVHIYTDIHTYGLTDIYLCLQASQASHDANISMLSMLSLAAFKETSDAGVTFA